MENKMMKDQGVMEDKEIRIQEEREAHSVVDKVIHYNLIIKEIIINLQHRREDNLFL